MMRWVASGVADNTEGRKASTDGVNWKVNVAYKASDEVLVYGQWAQGFRAPQFQRPISPEHDADGDGLVEFSDGIERKVPEGLLDPDFVDNYEIGVKIQSRDGRFRGGLTAFYIDWAGIPVPSPLTAVGGQAYLFNAGKAVVKGIEFEVAGEVGNGLFAEFSASWVSSKLAEDFEGFGDKGANLPGSADHNAKAALEKRFDLGGHEAFVRGDWTYVGKYYSSFVESGLSAGDYHLFDASAGVKIDNFTIGVYAKNLTNRMDFTWVDNVFGVGRAYRLRPRTIGINLGAAFKRQLPGAPERGAGIVMVVIGSKAQIWRSRLRVYLAYLDSRREGKNMAVKKLTALWYVALRSLYPAATLNYLPYSTRGGCGLFMPTRCD